MKILSAAQSVLKRLNQSGYESFLVGGCVRDLLMGVEPKDWDITTSALPQETIKVFQDEKVIETGLRHGTVSVLLDSVFLEITTYRIDGTYTDHRRPDSVSFTRTLKEDLARRDFTMNAIAYSPEIGIIDPYGGEEDLKNHRIRCVGEPLKRFSEDGLRILRALRFSSVLGFQIEERTSDAIHRKKELLRSVSAERVREELTKLLCGDFAGEVFLSFFDVIGTVIPELLPMEGVDQKNPHHCFDLLHHTAEVIRHSPNTPVSRFAALFHDIGKPSCFSVFEDGIGHFYGHAPAGKEIARTVMERLKFDRETETRVLLLIANHDAPIVSDRKAVRRLLNKMGEEALRELFSLKRADHLALAEPYRERQKEIDAAEKTMKELLSEDACFSLKDLAVDGNDLLELGLSGREIGITLRRLLEAVLDEKIPNERDALLREIKKGTV